MPSSWRDELIQYLPGVGPQRQEALDRLGLHGVFDVLRHFPLRYEDRRQMASIADLAEGETVVVSGMLQRFRQRRVRGRSILSADLRDATGQIELLWFHQAYIAEWIPAGAQLCVFGKVSRRGKKLQIIAPEFEIDTGDDDADGRSLHLQRIVPIYAATKGLHQRFLRWLADRCLQRGTEYPESPYDFLEADRISARTTSEQDVSTQGHSTQGLSAREAYRAIHFPSSFADLEAARSRFIFEEHFRFASRLVFRRQSSRAVGAPALRRSAELDRKIRSIFPFTLSGDQNRVIEEIASDLSLDVPMYRLLQGDVGTGKTAVALYASLVAVRGGWQAVIMAPTEVLAEQHHRAIRRYLSQYPVRVDLLTGSTRAGERRDILAGLASGATHIAVGTHALIQDDVEWARCGLAVIDEQHRFGVQERKKLRLKGSQPHLLVMTATPIPRSLCMTCYGDLDLSVLRERPENRLPVVTRLVSDAKRAAALDFVRRQLASGRQAFFVYPLIEESDDLGLPAAVSAHERLQTEVFPDFRVELLHGKLSAVEKEGRLDSFRRGETQVLVTTVVVEVGIDVPNATVIYFEDASRFGLAQLHQLRGRVGRGRYQGYCFVELAGGSEARERLKIFGRIESGFDLAEADLRLRGPGDYLGLRQSGVHRRRLGDPLSDPEAFSRVLQRAREFWEKAPALEYRERWREVLEVADGGADSGFD